MVGFESFTLYKATQTSCMANKWKIGILTGLRCTLFHGLQWWRCGQTGSRGDSRISDASRLLVVAVACDGVALLGRDQTAEAFAYCRTTYIYSQDPRLYLVISRLQQAGFEEYTLSGPPRDCCCYLTTVWQYNLQVHTPAATFRYVRTNLIAGLCCRV